MGNKVAVMIVTTLMLSACGTIPQHKAGTPVAATKAPSSGNGGGYLAGDGPGKDIPVNLDSIPDAVPKIEPLHRYANRPYIALGKTYRPMTVVGNYKERGIASWYGKKFNGERTSSGEKYDMYAMTAAHPILPLPSYARVTNLSNRKSVIVRINDRGPFMNDRIIDLSYTAAYKLGIINDGSAEVEVESLNPEVIVKTIAPSSVQSRSLESSAPKPVAPTAPAVAAATAAIPAPAAAATAAPVVAVAPAVAPAPAAVTVAPAATPALPAVIPVVASATAKDPVKSDVTTAAKVPDAAPVVKASSASSDGAVYLQLGAFSSEAGAEAYLDKMRRKLGDTGKQQLKLTSQDGLVRVHIGPYASLGEARSNADGMVDKLGFKPMVNLP